MKTRRLNCLLAVILVSLIGLQGKTMSDLQTENRRLETLATEAERLAAQNQRLPMLRNAATELGRLREETGDLLKLRNEVHQLRDQEKKLETARGDNQRLRQLTVTGADADSKDTAVTPFLGLKQFEDQGQDSVEATVRTLFWAIRQGDFERIKSCVEAGNLNSIIRKVTGAVPPSGYPDSKEEERRQMQEFLQDFRGARVFNQRNLSPDEAVLTLQLSIGGDNAGVYDVPFRAKQVGSQWKLIPVVQ